MEQRSPVLKTTQGRKASARRLAPLPQILMLMLALQGCASGTTRTVRHAISNPFPVEWGYEGRNQQKDSVVLRTKKGDRSVEVEFPGDPAAFSDFAVPVSPAFSDGHPLRSTGAMQEDITGNWRNTKPTYSDREITSNFPKGPAASNARRDLESELGVLPPEQSTPQMETSYLAALDEVKKLFRNGRYESALLQVDELLQIYPTDPKLHQMRGTLLDRTGQPELAMRSWAEAIELDPANQGLKKFVDRRRSIRAMGTRMPAAQSELQSQPQTQGTMPVEGVKQ